MEIRILAILEQAMNLSLGLNEEDSAYDLHFISEKLTVCSKHLEVLSDLSMELTKIMIGVMPISNPIAISRPPM